MHIAFRADASTAIGAGHVMRCLALADYLAARGARVRFVCAEYPGHLAAEIKSYGMEMVLLSPEDANAETAAKRALADMTPLDLLVVDHYGIDVRWETTFRPLTKRIMVIDDLADRNHDCDLLLDQNLREGAQERYTAHVPAGCRMLLGPKHALLRKEFMVSGLRTKRNGTVRRVLVSYGGSDSSNESGKLLDALCYLRAKIPRIDLVLGSSNPNREAVAKRARNVRDIHVHESTNEMARLIDECDLAVGSCGVSALERCALGMPSLVVITDNSQSEGARLLHSCGAVKCLGKAANVDAPAVARALSWAIESPRKIATMSSLAFNVTAGWKERLEQLIDDLAGPAEH